MAMALAAFGATSASSAGAEYSQAPLPSTACRSGITAHLFTFAQARRCAPEATVITTGQVVSKAGRYLLQQPGGYALVGFGNRVLSASGALVDAQAYTCGVGTFREIYSWQYYGDLWLSEDTGNCVVTGSYVYNVWNSPGCNAAGSCVTTRFVLGDYTYNLNPGIDVTFYSVGGWFQASNGCRQYLSADWSESWYCF